MAKNFENNFKRITVEVVVIFAPLSIIAYPACALPSAPPLILVINMKNLPNLGLAIAYRLPVKSSEL